MGCMNISAHDLKTLWAEISALRWTNNISAAICLVPPQFCKTNSQYLQPVLTWSLHDSCMQDTHAFNISTVHTQQLWIHLHFTTLLLFSFPSILAAWLAELSGTILWQQVCSASQPCKLCMFGFKNKPLYISFMLFHAIQFLFFKFTVIDLENLAILVLAMSIAPSLFRTAQVSSTQK